MSELAAEFVGHTLEARRRGARNDDVLVGICAAAYDANNAHADAP